MSRAGFRLAPGPESSAAFARAGGSGPSASLAGGMALAASPTFGPLGNSPWNLVVLQGGRRVCRRGRPGYR